MKDWVSRIRADREEWIGWLDQLLRIPSMSALPQHRPDIEQAAAWLVGQLSAAGFQAESQATRGHPIVYAEYRGSPTSDTTLLVYGHYDVQPAEPGKDWRTAPFEPTIMGDAIYARGAMDMKGQLVAFLAALKILQREGPLPLQIKCILEGEEEIGSPSLDDYLCQHRTQLACDAVLNLDGLMTTPTTPSLVYGLRGLAYFDLELVGLEHDLHSGLFGGSVMNPAFLLCKLLSGMLSSDGQIALPGFYRLVVPLTTTERQRFAQNSSSHQDNQAESGAFCLGGEAGYTSLERRCARPSLDINGLTAGYGGEGAKTVIPARAGAKISFRLVPNQTPDEVYRLLKAYIEDALPEGIKVRLTMISSGLPVMIDPLHWAMQAAARTLEATFGIPPAFIREGGTIPAVAMIKHRLKHDSVLLGCGYAGDGMHGPNEHMRLPLMEKNIEIYLRFLSEVAHHAREGKDVNE